MLLGELRREPERGSLAEVAVHPDVAAHLLHELATDRETQARAAVLPRGRAIGLDEGIEEFRLHLWGDADAAIADFKANQQRIPRLLRLAGTDDNIAGFGELHRIADEVREHLAKAPGIA